MSMVDEQFAFAQDVAKLIQHAAVRGFVVTFGEVARTVEQQQIYMKQGKSKTMNSMHLKRLAVDFNVFKDGKLIPASEFAVLGKYWEALNPKNRWGGNFDKDWAKRDNFIDGPHFERQVK